MQSCQFLGQTNIAFSVDRGADRSLNKAVLVSIALQNKQDGPQGSHLAFAAPNFAIHYRSGGKPH